MTNNLKCPFCGAELQTDNEMARLILWRCHTPGCLLNGWHSADIIQNLIAGKKAQDALDVAIETLQMFAKPLDGGVIDGAVIAVQATIEEISEIMKGGK